MLDYKHSNESSFNKRNLVQQKSSGGIATSSSLPELSHDSLTDLTVNHEKDQVKKVFNSNFGSDREDSKRELSSLGTTGEQILSFPHISRSSHKQYRDSNL